MSRLHSGEPIVKNRLSQDVLETEEADVDSNNDRKLPAHALKTAEDEEDDGEDSEAFFDAEDEEGGKLEEVMSQGEQALFQEVAQKKRTTRTGMMTLQCRRKAKNRWGRQMRRHWRKPRKRRPKGGSQRGGTPR
jgi:hypothetical protein